MTLLSACKKEPTTTPDPGAESKPQASFYDGDTLILTLDLTEQSLFSMPENPTGAESMIGWELEGENRFLGFGDSFDASGVGKDLVFRTVHARIATKTEVLPSLDDSTLLFGGTVNADDYRRLVSLFGAQNVEVGLLIAPYQNVTGGDRRFTLDCGAEGLLVRPVTPTVNDGQTGCDLLGKTDPIADGEILEKYAARAYIKLTANGSQTTLYAPYYPLEHTCSLYGASALAFEDLTVAADAKHKHAVQTAKGTRYSAYTAAERELLRARLDRVVHVSTSASGLVDRYSRNNVDFYYFQYYTSPYRVKYVIPNTEKGERTYVIVGRDEADFNTVTAYFIDDSYRAPRAEEWQEDGIYITVESKTH